MWSCICDEPKLSPVWKKSCKKKKIGNAANKPREKLHSHVNLYGWWQDLNGWMIQDWTIKISISVYITNNTSDNKLSVLLAKGTGGLSVRQAAIITYISQIKLGIRSIGNWYIVSLLVKTLFIGYQNYQLWPTSTTN